MFIKWLDQEASGQKLSSHFHHAAPDTEEVYFPGLDPPSVPLPMEPALSRYVDGYFKSIHLMYPCIDESTIRSMLQDVQSARQESEINMLLLYLVVSLGADCSTDTRSTTEVGERYLQIVWKALPSILGRVDRIAVQCLLLMTIAYRCVSLF